MQELLKIMIDNNASDMHLTAGSLPRLRVHGKLTPIGNMSVLTSQDVKQMCYSILAESQKQKFEQENELDFSFGLKGLSRFRGNLFVQRGAVAGAFRTIPFQIKTLQELGLPPFLEELTKKPRGLVLVTGPTGSGKSSTLAAMVDKINHTRSDHIITIEDPIEYVYQSKTALVNQREVGSDTFAFKKALKHVLRQDPDVVLLGEMRDIETIETALTIAETGHLCFATLHTNSCVQTINRIIDVFPSSQQPQVRAQLSFVLEGVISQLLLTRTDGMGRVVSTEIMIPNAAIRNLIREDKIHQIYSQMQVGQSKFSMQTMNQSLVTLYQKRLVTLDEILSRSSEPDEIRQMIANSNVMKSNTR
ncbi:MAG: type IV pilus twitching motility protein PilT [Deltaproteobacteria bacterium]|nr:type IV pilus twitching motility protein PilT [Deltaproteobacteria bacterium]